MIKRTRASIPKLILHKVGNKFNHTRNLFSEEPVVFDEESYQLMLPYLLRPFAAVTERFKFTHHADVSLNEINTYARRLFEDPGQFVEVSRHVVEHLYEQSNSAQIKTGDVIVALFEDIEYREILTQAVGIFKIESKTDFFQTFMEGKSLDIAVQKGISTRKVDKGCLILNYEDDEGLAVLTVDNNRYDAQYWTRNFLNIKYADDANHHTLTYIDLCREFSGEVLKPEYSSREHSHFLARTLDFLKENETVNLHDFKEEVFDVEEQKEQFDKYKKAFEEERGVLVRNQFQVADRVVKKQKQKLKTEIRLDTHIQIKLDVEAPDASAEYLELGYDEEKKMKYYKVYFNEEQ